VPTVLIYSDGPGGAGELSSLLSGFKDWEIFDYEQLKSAAPGRPAIAGPVDFHFLLYSRKLDKLSIEDLGKIRQQLPFSDIIYYYGFLYDQQYLILARYTVNACIVGLQRQRYLSELLPRLWEKHWKKIPPRLFPLDSTRQPAVAKKLITYIENHTLDHCNIKDIAAGLGQSESHLRAGFKQLFKMNFRDFKQNLFNHYETMLLVEKKLKPNDVYKLFNYANLANFSRSFKSRHGETWRDFSVGEV
jgi:AraC-like DNA-binding protein